MAKTNAQKQRAMRQEKLREYLANQGLLSHVVETIKNISELDPTDQSFTNKLKQKEVLNNQRMALIKKYLPDLSHTSIEPDTEDGKFTITIQSYADKPTE